MTPRRRADTQRPGDSPIELRAAQNALVELETRHSLARRINVKFTDPAEIARLLPTDAIATQSRSLSSARQRVEKLDARMTSQHPEMKAAMRLRDRQQQRMQELVDEALDRLAGDVAAVRQRVQSLSQAIDQVEAFTASSQGNDEKLQQLQQDVAWAQRRVDLLTPGRETPEKPRDKAPLPTIDIVEEASIPPLPASPDRPAIVITSVLIGLGLGILLAMLREAARRRHVQHREH